MQSRHTRISLIGLILVMALFATAGIAGAHDGPIPAADGEVIAEGFNGPQGLLLDGDGNVWVIDSGLGGDTDIKWISAETGEEVDAKLGDSAHVARINAADHSVEMIAALPSINLGQEAVGGARLALLDGTLYATVGQGIGASDTEIPANFGGVLSIGADGTVAMTANTWAFEVANNPQPNILDSHPYGLQAGPDGMLYVADAGGNDLLKIDPTTGEVLLVAVFDSLPGVFPRPDYGDEMLTDPVPTDVVFDAEGNAYVSFLSGAPFVPGSSKVVMVAPDGTVSDYATGYTMLTDLAWGPDGNLYGVQFGVFGEQGPTPNSGAVIHIKGGTDFDVAIEGLSFPIALGFNEAGDAFVAINAVGPPGSGAVVAFHGIAPEETAEPENGCAVLPAHDSLTEVLSAVVEGADNGGFGFHMWATLVDRDGVVCAVTFSGADRGDQFPGSRVISAQKANTANAFSLPGLALSTGNLYSAVQPGGSLFGLQASNPVDTSVAYFGQAKNFGTEGDPMTGLRLGGVNVFGGGLALYNADGALLGAVGVSGDSSCTDHIIAWKIRDALALDNVPSGVSPTGDDNIVFDMTENANGKMMSASGWGHPTCGLGEVEIAAALPESFPVGVNAE